MECIDDLMMTRIKTIITFEVLILSPPHKHSGSAPVFPHHRHCHACEKEVDSGRQTDRQTDRQTERERERERETERET
jgi:hypothetical protein